MYVGEVTCERFFLELMTRLISFTNNNELTRRPLQETAERVRVRVQAWNI